MCWVRCEESACCLVWVEDEVVCPSPCISCRYDWMFAFAMFMLLCVDVMVIFCVGRQSYWCLWCWSVRCVYVEVWVIARRLVEHHFLIGVLMFCF